MDAKTLREFVSDHPEGVIIRMIDGREYTIPHRDFVWFGPDYGKSEARAGRYATTFGVYEDEAFRLVNVMLVAEVMSLKDKQNGNGHGKSGRGKKK